MSGSSPNPSSTPGAFVPMTFLTSACPMSLPLRMESSVRRRLSVLTLVVGLITAGSLFGSAGPAAGQTPPEDAARGVVLAGLKRSPANGACRGKFELAHLNASFGL